MNYEWSLKNDMKRLAVIVLVVLMGCAGTQVTQTEPNTTDKLKAIVLSSEFTQEEDGVYSLSVYAQAETWYYAATITVVNDVLGVSFLTMVQAGMILGWMVDEDGDGLVDQHYAEMYGIVRDAFTLEEVQQHYDGLPVFVEDVLENMAINEDMAA